ncbi:hypothetical protein [Paenibacillus sp. 32O-W]|uniref:hypothetical protein n=1 Tax=Paenibacillus sp. 32O-W TaxID=1695218 RepID=UPI00119E08B3|nr:hypothetical protein [Paenibacillus sp. 32O-W]
MIRGPNTVNFKAIELIELELAPILKKGKDIRNMKLMVCPTSEIARHSSVETRFGKLIIAPGEYIPKGYSYIIENPGKRGRSFAWVTKKKSSPASVGERTRELVHNPLLL